MSQKSMSELLPSRAEERIRLGMLNSQRWRNDPRVLLFTMARYKFVAKMLTGCRDVIEVGCGDGWATHLVLQEVETVRAYDLDAELIKDACLYSAAPRLSFDVWDMVAEPVTPQADACYLLDVFEHIVPEHESQFLANLAASIKKDGICIVGAPSLESQSYASSTSRAGHVNCKSGRDLRAALERYFSRVFLFGMNDEVLHTGFDKMSHYVLCLCVGVKNPV
jgi:2-polyprenyl-3-methyl-5-hydroxy-6-metoxy-1,4-benzoquinol methylase